MTLHCLYSVEYVGYVIMIEWTDSDTAVCTSLRWMQSCSQPWFSFWGDTLPSPFLSLPSSPVPSFPSPSLLPFHFPSLPTWSSQRIWGSAVSSPRRSWQSPADKRYLANLEHKIKHNDNSHFDWIFNQLTVRSLHKLIYIGPLNWCGKYWLKDRSISFVIILEGFEPVNPPPLKYGAGWMEERKCVRLYRP